MNLRGARGPGWLISHQLRHVKGDVKSFIKSLAGQVRRNATWEGPMAGFVSCGGPGKTSVFWCMDLQFSRKNETYIIIIIMIQKHWDAYFGGWAPRTDVGRAWATPIYFSHVFLAMWKGFGWKLPYKSSSYIENLRFLAFWGDYKNL